MTTTTSPAEPITTLPPRREPEPPTDAEDRANWRLVGRGRGIPQAPPLVSIQADFDRAQSEWLTEESRRTGLDYVSLLKKLVDGARANNHQD